MRERSQPHGHAITQTRSWRRTYWSRKGAFKALIGPPYKDFPLLLVSRHALVLRKQHGGGGLIFRRPARDFFRNAVAKIDQNLPRANERLPRCAGIGQQG